MIFIITHSEEVKAMIEQKIDMESLGTSSEEMKEAV
jgi:DNA repair exonuclease SbcCD ATPase subunit